MANKSPGVVNSSRRLTGKKRKCEYKGQKVTDDRQQAKAGKHTRTVYICEDTR